MDHLARPLYPKTKCRATRSVANVHGVAALVYHNLEKLDLLHYTTAEASDTLKKALMMSLSRNTRNTEAMAYVLRLLNRENIKTVLLKGLALELSVYGNAGLRQMTDVDVLVTRDNCLKARKILMNKGFTSLPVKSVFHKAIIADAGKHLPSLIKNGFSVEFHHQLFGAEKDNLTGKLYETSSEKEIKGEKTFIPEARIFFLYLVRHLCMHEMNNESQLRLYTDLVVLIENFRDEIINVDLIEYAKKAGMSQMLAWKLEPLRDLWGISFPEWINEFINKWYNPDSINKINYFLKSTKDNPPSDKAKYYRYHLSEIPGMHRKILFLLGDLFPTIRFMKKRYNLSKSWQAIFYYPLRFGKLWYLVKR